MVVPLLRSVLWQQRQILSPEYMVLLCSHVDRHRSVPSQLWLLLQKHRSLTDLTNLKLQRDICITTISPSYSVGDTKPSRGPGRREIGHGALAERALVPVLPSEEEFPYAIRTVSETFESNGSTSQASICASTMSLMAAGVPIKKPGSRYFLWPGNRRYR